MTRSLLAGILAIGTVSLGLASCGTSGSDAPRSAFGGGGSAGSSGGAGAAGEGGSGGSSGSGGSGGTLFDAGPVDDGSTVNPDGGCAATSAKSTPLEAHVMFQLDTSGSMNCLPTEDADTSTTCAQSAQPGSRWNILRDALKNSLASIPASNSVGLMHFPDPNFLPGFSSCVPLTPDVALAPLSLDLSALQSKLGQLSPGGGTPTHDAAVAAYNILHADTVPANRYIVLATDGEANFCQNCNDLCSVGSQINADTQAFIQQMKDVVKNEGIRMFVIGVPGSENFRAALSQLAEAGGTAQPGCMSGDLTNSPSVGNCHYDMTTQAANFGQAIAAALSSISGQVLSCSYDIPQASAGSFDPNNVDVALTSNGVTTAIPKDATNGWSYTPDGKHIQISGTACDQVKATTNGEVDIVYGCPTGTLH